jgi:hypothetical protein
VLHTSTVTIHWTLQLASTTKRTRRSFIMHTSYGITQPVFNKDGTLNYVYENVTISSADSRPGKGNRSVPCVHPPPFVNSVVVVNIPLFSAHFREGMLERAKRVEKARGKRASDLQTQPTECVRLKSAEWCSQPVAGSFAQL